MELIIAYLGTGRLEKDLKKNKLNLVVGNFLDLNQKIIPFFNRYPICGKKQLDYQDWCKIVEIYQKESPLTNENLEKIKEIKAQMNKNR